MSISRLESISLNNFRSIGGRITIPLDGQVVLLYGANGAGKTSVLSGLELALTGSIDAMKRADPKYRDHLIHRGESKADVSVTGRLADRELKTWELTYRHRDWVGAEALTVEDARYFSERCYLAQATLGRLLEIYASRDAGQDSALARFVNDVLGLDALENLIDGLQQARDIRNTRRLIPEIAELERELEVTSRQEAERRAAHNRLASRKKQLELDIYDHLLALDPKISEFSPEVVAFVLSEREVNSDNESLIRLTNFQREIHAMVRRLFDAKQSLAGSDLSALEAAAAGSTQLATGWLSTVGAAIDEILGEARSLFPDLPSVAETNPTAALTSGLERIGLELRRTDDLLSADKAALSRRDELAQASERDRSRIAVIDEQIADESAGAADIARLLAELVPHLQHTDECVVCGRDYSEVSPQEPLAAAVSRRAAQFSDQAERLSALSQARASATSDLNRASAEINSLQPQIMETSERSNLIAKKAQLEQWTTKLAAHQGEAVRGSGLISEGADARRALAAAHGSLDVRSEVRQSAAELARDLELDRATEIESLDEMLRLLEEQVSHQLSSTTDRVALRSRLSELQKSWSRAAEELTIEGIEQQRVQRHRSQLEQTQGELEARRTRARQLRRTASGVQRSVIQTVFNENLNSLWRDLFVRLAPTEPFVPAFHVSDESPRTISPQLITLHRSGGRGGSPGAMLSAGNLNTAALTLFLALHLVAGERLPLLILDDPVQSMDDVHISQFAALLRTLSRQHKRQVIISIHDRALFEYLTLELSPAFEGDRLITVELKRQNDGSTTAEPVYRDWMEDPVILSA